MDAICPPYDSPAISPEFFLHFVAERCGPTCPYCFNERSAT